jgi:hypothetical protein
LRSNLLERFLARTVFPTPGVPIISMILAKVVI